MILNDLAQALEHKDYVALSKCFAFNSQLFDYCPALLGKKSFHVCGRPAIEMFYRNRFILGGLSIRNIQIHGDDSLNLFISYGRDTICADVRVEDYEPESGLIKKLVIRPA